MLTKIYHYGRLTVGLWLLAVLLLGCQSTSDPNISIENAWGRPSPKVATAGVFYMRIINNGGEPDKLVSGESPACGVVELHESYMTGEGVMGMRPVEGGFIEIPAKGEVELKIGGLHLMCIEKLEDFDVGTVLPLTLRFEQSGDITTEVEIREPQ